ncbi:MAG: neutral/alkaline non-lysosomal ceramidase N-terminal domain-containing protein [Bryobacteraceae bacterium]
MRSKLMQSLVCSAALALVLGMVPDIALGATLRAAAAKTDITPPAGTPMWGYARRSGPATGTLDPLMARVLVLEAGPQRVAIVTLDLGRAFGEKAIAGLRAAVQRSSAVSYVFLAASHTHSGPVILDEYAGAPPAWETEALSRIAHAIDDACGRLVEARIGTGYGVSYIGHNRLKTNPDRTVSWLERNPTKVPTSPFDPTVAVLRVETVDRKPLAILVNYACHPVVFGPDNRQFSADFPGAMAQAAEQALGQGTLVMFMQGGAGDINPYYAVTPLQQDAIKQRDWSGQELGREAARVAESIRTEAPSDASLDFAEQPLNFGFRWDFARFREDMAGIFGSGFETEFGPPVRERVGVPVSTLLIDKKIAILGLSGEPFVDFQTNWRSRCPVQDAFFAGYANGYHGYFPTIEETTLGGYGTASVTTWVEPGAGERMVDHGIIQIHTMLGRLSNLPYRAKF